MKTEQELRDLREKEIVLRKMYEKHLMEFERGERDRNYRDKELWDMCKLNYPLVQARIGLLNEILGDRR